MSLPVIGARGTDDASQVANTPPMSFTIEYSTISTFGVPQPPFSTKKVPKIKKIKTKSVFERATSIISDKVFRGVVGEVKGRPLHRRNPGRPLYWPRTLSLCLFRDESKPYGSSYRVFCVFPMPLLVSAQNRRILGKEFRLARCPEDHHTLAQQATTFSLTSLSLRRKLLTRARTESKIPRAASL